jgi:hypothetical protein
MRRTNSQILFFIIWAIICIGIAYWVLLWFQTSYLNRSIHSINRQLKAGSVKRQNESVRQAAFIEPTEAQEVLQHAEEAALRDCQVPPSGLGMNPWEDWNPLLPQYHQGQSRQIALNSLADEDPRQAFCNICEGDAPVVEGFTSEFFDWMNAKQQQDNNEPLVPADPIATPPPGAKPAFPYPQEDANPNREVLPGTLPIPADNPASNAYDKPDAEKRKRTLVEAQQLLEKLQGMRADAYQNPKTTRPLTSGNGSLVESQGKPLAPPVADEENYTPAPQAMMKGSAPRPVPQADMTQAVNPRLLGSGIATGGPKCRFVNTPRCSPDFPNYTGASIGFEGADPLFRCNGPDGGKQAEAVVTIENGEVKKAYLVEPGKGYTVAPKVKLIGGGGDGAKLETRINPTTGSVVEIVVRDPGFGYHSTPRVQLDNPGIASQCFLCCKE